jgi:hypothetical protein
MQRASRILILAGAATLGFGGIAAASPAPGCTAPQYRQFDFWVGDWDTFDEGNSTASVARTHVDLIAAGCAVHELYEQNDGLIGDSILSFDPVRKVWQQTWVTNYGSLMVVSGTLRDDTLTLEGESHVRDGKTLRQRISWKREGSGVRESSVWSKDDGKTWTEAFNVLFEKHRE